MLRPQLVEGFQVFPHTVYIHNIHTGYLHSSLMLDAKVCRFHCMNDLIAMLVLCSVDGKPCRFSVASDWAELCEPQSRLSFNNVNISSVLQNLMLRGWGCFCVSRPPSGRTVSVTPVAQGTGDVPSLVRWDAIKDVTVHTVEHLHVPPLLYCLKQTAQGPSPLVTVWVI